MPDAPMWREQVLQTRRLPLLGRLLRRPEPPPEPLRRCSVTVRRVSGPDAALHLTTDDEGWVSAPLEAGVYTLEKQSRWGHVRQTFRVA